MNHIRRPDRLCTKKNIFVIILSIALISLFGCASEKTNVNTFEKAPIMDFSFPIVENQNYYDALDFLEAQQYEKAEEAFILAIDELKAQAVPDGDLQIAVVEYELGQMYIDLEKYKDSYDYLMKAYISFRERYGENAESTLRAKTGICLYDIAVENYDLAIASLLDINKQTNTNAGKMRTATLLGTAYMDRSDYESAKSWYQKAIEIGEKQKGCDLSDLYNNYGVLCMLERDWENALKYLQAAKKAAQNYDESRLSQIILNIAQVYVKMGDAVSANKIINDLIANDSFKYGSNSSYVGYDYMAVSSIYKMMNDWDKQLRSLNTAIDILIKIEGENSHTMSVLYDEVGSYFYRTGDDLLAVSYLNKSIEIKKNILEEKSDGARVAYANLGVILLRLQDNKAAFEAYQQEYEVAVYLFGENDPRTAEALLDLAEVCVQMGDLESADQYAENGIAILQKNGIDTGSVAGTAYYIMGKLYAAKGQNDQAKYAWYKALDIYEKAAYREPAIVLLYSKLGDLCLDTEDYAEAKENYANCIENMLEIYRSQSESMFYINNISELYNRIGFCLFKQSNYDEALRYYTQGEESLTRYLDGKQNDEDDNSKSLYRNLAVIYNNIAAVYENMGKTADATDYALISYHIVIEQELDMDDFQKLLQRMERLNISVE